MKLLRHPSPGDFRIGALWIAVMRIDHGGYMIFVKRVPKGAGCSAHGERFCEDCSRNGPMCDQCSTFAWDGMHWDTCANRARSVRAG